MNYSINTYEKTNKENQVYFKATFSTLEENEQEALQLLVEILQESVFDQEKMINEKVMIGDQEYALTAVSMGNPHVITYEKSFSDGKFFGCY